MGVSNLTRKIEKLDLVGLSYLTEEHVKTLVKRCNKKTQIKLGSPTSINRHSLNLFIDDLNLQISSEKTRIAGPCQPEYNYRNWVIKPKNDEQGLWEINAEREKLFTNNFN